MTIEAGTPRVLVVDDEENIQFIVGVGARHGRLRRRHGRSRARGARAGGLLPTRRRSSSTSCSLTSTGSSSCSESETGDRRPRSIFLTARDATDDRVRGLTSGGSDYLVKPFAVAELVARVRLRPPTQAGRHESPPPLRRPHLDTDGHRVIRAGDVVHLSPTEYKLLHYLLVNSGRVLVAGADPGPRVVLRLRRRFVGGRHLHQLPTTQDRSRRATPDPDDSRYRVHLAGRTVTLRLRLLLAMTALVVLITVGALMVIRSQRSFLVAQVDDQLAAAMPIANRPVAGRPGGPLPAPPASPGTAGDADTPISRLFVGMVADGAVEPSASRSTPRRRTGGAPRLRRTRPADRCTEDRGRRRRHHPLSNRRRTSRELQRLRRGRTSARRGRRAR